MKTSLLVVLSLLLIGSVASAAEIISDPADGGSTQVTWDGRYPYSFTQNADPTTFNAGGYTCGNVTYNYITDTWSMRRFYFADEGIAVPFTVQSIDYGIRRFITLGDSVPGPYDMTLYVGTIPVGAELLFANITWVNQVLVPLTPADNPIPPAVGVPKTTPINALISDTVNNDLVVAFFMPITYYMQPRIRTAMAANNTGETWEPYFAFADCAWPEPVTPTTLGGAGQAQIVIVVNGDVYEPPAPGACCRPDGTCVTLLQSECLAPNVWFGGLCDPNPCPPVPTEETSWGQIKATYR